MIPLIPSGLSASTGRGSTTTNETVEGTTSKRRVLSQEAQNKIIYDILSADQGLANLLSGAGMVGGSGGSTGSSQGLLAQDFIAKAVGEIALLTAEEISTADQTTVGKNVTKETKASGSLGTVICTELLRQGKFPQGLYNDGIPHFHSLHSNTVAGYQIWAKQVVKLMQKSERLSNFLLPIAISRYHMTTGLLPFTIWGLVTIYIGQPICYLIGACLPKENVNGDQRTA